MRGKKRTPPGGYGTLDELFEALTLVQTGKMRPFPIVMVGREYWQGLQQWLQEQVLDMGFSDDHDFNFFSTVDSAKAAVEIIIQHVRMLRAQDI